jgi:chemotaxis protein histidine kinase CheA
MKLTNYGECRAEPSETADDSFESLRAMYCQRLKGDRLHLLKLSEALARGDPSRAQVLDELRNRAHRLSGTAAIFELTGVAALARALELAVDGVAVDAEDVSRAGNSDTVMCAALRALIRVIDDLGKPPRAARIHAPRRRGMLQNG